MEKLKGKIALVTGASSGIGEEICRQFVNKGMTVIGFARRENKLMKLQKELTGKLGKFHYVRVDLCSEENILEAFDSVKKQFTFINILVNCAGVWKAVDPLGNTNDWKLLFDTNVLGLSICSREAVKIMEHFNLNGHIVNINSDCGHFQMTLMNDYSVYSATKFSVTKLTESLRELMCLKKLPIRVTSISPGLVDTEMAANMNPDEVPLLKPFDIAETILFVLAAPQHVNISEILIRPTGETMLPFIKESFNSLQLLM